MFSSKDFRKNSQENKISAKFEWDSRRVTFQGLDGWIWQDNFI